MLKGRPQSASEEGFSPGRRLVGIVCQVLLNPAISRDPSQGLPLQSSLPSQQQHLQATLHVARLARRMQTGGC